MCRGSLTVACAGAELLLTAAAYGIHVCMYNVYIYIEMHIHTIGRPTYVLQEMTLRSFSDMTLRSIFVQWHQALFGEKQNVIPEICSAATALRRSTTSAFCTAPDADR